MLYLNIIFAIIISLYLYWLWGLLRAFRSDAPYVPMSRAVLERMMALVEPRAGDIWVDLGSGDGRVLIEAAKRFSVRGIGIERISALRTLARFKIILTGLRGSVRIKRGDFFTENISDANIVSFYLLPHTGARLMEKLRRELQPGSLVVFHRYPIQGIPLIKEDPECKIYVARL